MADLNPSPTAAILVIGEEVLTAKVADENSPFLLRELRGLGVSVRRVEIIPDEVQVIADRVKAARLAFDHVFTAGGIGPTHDDVTVEGVARAFGVPVVRAPIVENLIREYCQEHFYERDLRMADIPQGAELIHGEGAFFSRWPVVAMNQVYLLPGIPSILRAKFALLRPRLQSRPFLGKVLYSREGEGAIAAILDQLVIDFPALSIGSYPHLDTPDHKVMITLDGRDAALLETAAQALRLALGSAFVRME